MTYIVIEGVIGVGKTALTRLLSKRLALPPVYEQFEENPFLSNFYQDRQRYAFQTEVFFLLNRYRQQRDAVKPLYEEGGLVCDYLFAKTRLFAGLNLSGDEPALFEQLYEALNERVPTPDLTVYLTASTATLMSRIFDRDRSMERNIDPEYIAHLAEIYSGFFGAYSGSPCLQIETDDLDLVRDREAQDHVIALIKDAIGGT